MKICDFKRSRLEYKNLIGNFVILIFHLVISTTFLLVDYVLVEILQLIRLNGATTFAQNGEYNVDVKVSGKGALAAYLRAILTQFDTENFITTELSNQPCLPDARELEVGFYVKIYFLYFLLLVCLMIEVYVNRLKCVVCGLFYPKRNKYRVLFLYNKLLKNRRNLRAIKSRRPYIVVDKNTTHFNDFIPISFNKDQNYKA